MSFFVEKWNFGSIVKIGLCFLWVYDYNIIIRVSVIIGFYWSLVVEIWGCVVVILYKGFFVI